eukprot:Gb_34943 [translate_table: standard]
MGSTILLTCNMFEEAIVDEVEFPLLLPTLCVDGLFQLIVYFRHGVQKLWLMKLNCGLYALMALLLFTDIATVVSDFKMVTVSNNPIHVVSGWVRRQPPKVKAFLAVVSGITTLVILRFVVHNHDNLFIASEANHVVGISILIYKLMKEKTCATQTSYGESYAANTMQQGAPCSWLSVPRELTTLLLNKGHKYSTKGGEEVSFSDLEEGRLWRIVQQAQVYVMCSPSVVCPVA